MYLVPDVDYAAGRLRSQPRPKPPPVKTKRVTKRSGRTASQHPLHKWVALHTKLLEADITEADFLRKVLPQPAPPKAPHRLPSAEQRPKIETVELAETPRQTLVLQRTEPPSAGTSYEVSKRRPSSGSDAAETSNYDDNGRGVYEVSSPYLNTVGFLNEQYGIRREGNTLMIGSAHNANHEKGDISIGDAFQRYEGSSGTLDTQKHQ